MSSIGTVRVRTDGSRQTEQAANVSRPRRRLDWVGTVAIAAIVTILAEVGARAGWISPFVLPAPTDVLDSLIDGFQTGIYWKHLVSTTSAAAVGFGLGATLAISAAGILVAIPVIERVLMPFVIAFQTMPKIAIAPLIVLWLGFGQNAKIFIVVVVVLFPILINTLQGLQIRDRDKAELMQSLGASRWQVFRYVRFPGALPYISAGLRLGVIFSLIGAIVAEFVGSQAGLGYILLQQRALFNVPGVFAILFLMMAIGLIFDFAMRIAEARIARWSRQTVETL